MAIAFEPPPEPPGGALKFVQLVPLFVE